VLCKNIASFIFLIFSFSRLLSLAILFLIVNNHLKKFEELINGRISRKVAAAPGKPTMSKSLLPWPKKHNHRGPLDK